MPVPCPCCKASNATGPNCRRCKADLAELFALDTHAEALLAEARNRIHAGDARRAAAIIDRALETRRTPEALRLRAVAAYLGRDFPAALAWYRSLEAACAKSS